MYNLVQKLYDLKLFFDDKLIEMVFEEAKVYSKQEKKVDEVWEEIECGPNWQGTNFFGWVPTRDIEPRKRF